MSEVISAGGGESVKSGPIGLAIILLLCVACYFLFKSMSKHLRKVREEFPHDAAPPGEATGGARATGIPVAGAPAQAEAETRAEARSADHDADGHDVGSQEVEASQRSAGPTDIPS